eukprot:gene5699-7092_t
MENNNIPTTVEENEETEYVDVNETAQELVLDGEKHQIPDEDDEDDMMDEEGDHEMKDDDEDEEDFVDESIQGFFEHKDSVYCTSVNQHRPYLAISGGGDDLAYLWNITNGQTVFQLKGHTDSISSAKFNFDGSLAATGGMDGVVKVWDVNTGNLVVNLEGPTEAIEWIDWHPNGNVLMAGSADYCAYMWTIVKGVLTATFVGHGGPVSCGGITPHSRKVVTGSEDGTIRVWNPRDSTTTLRIDQSNTFHENMITCMAFSPQDGNMVISGGEDYFPCISNLNTGKSIGRLQGHTNHITSVAWSNSNSTFVMSGSEDGSIRVWDLTSMQTRTTLKHKSTITKLLSHRTEPILFSSSVDKTICMWDERSGKQIKQFLGHQDSILDFDVNPEGRIVTASDDKVSLVFSLNPPSI